MDAIIKMNGVIELYLKQVNYSLLMSPLMKMANQYLKVNIGDREERTKKKNDFAFELGTYVITNRISKEKLVNEDNEGGIVSTGRSNLFRPEVNDIDLLFSVENKVTRRHVKFRMLRSIDQLIETHCIVKNKIPVVHQILEVFSYDTDEYLSKKIDLVRFAAKLL